MIVFHAEPNRTMKVEGHGNWTKHRSAVKVAAMADVVRAADD